MTNYKFLRWLLIIATTLVLAWLLPQLIKMSSESATKYDFTYYSSVARQFCYIRCTQNDIERVDSEGHIYTEEQFDSIVPLFYYRQMLSDGRMPDSIHGEPITIERIRNGAFYFRSRSREVDCPQIKLYPMYESMSGRVKLESPNDIFRCADRIEFIDIESNTLNEEKSSRYQKAMKKAGFQFPAQWVSGNPTTLKPYDEGYFIKDAGGQVFHLKQVNGKPFVNNTGMGKNLNIIHFSMQEVADHRFYGFAFDDHQTMYMVETGTYALKALPFKFNLYEENMMIMANMLYWTINMTSDKGKRSVAVNSQTLEKVDEMSQAVELDTWDHLAKWIIPFRIEVEHLRSSYVYPKIKVSNPVSLIFSIMLALAWGLMCRKKHKGRDLFTGIAWVLLTGMFGFTALLFYRK